MERKLSFSCNLEEKQSKSTEVPVTLKPEIQTKISSLEEEYNEISLKQDMIQETIIYELYKEKKGLVQELSSVQLELEFLKQDNKYYTKLLKTLDKQNVDFNKEVSEHVLRLKKLEIKREEINDSIELNEQRKERIERILTLDEAKIETMDVYNGKMVEVADNISNRRIKLEELEMNTKNIEKKKISFDDYFCKEKEATGDLIDVLQSFEVNNQRKKIRVQEDIEENTQKIMQLTDNIHLLKNQKEYIEKRLFKIKGNSKGILSNILKNEVYVIVTEELPKELSQGEADSIRSWNKLLLLNKNIKVATLDFNSDILNTIVNYKKMGWLPQSVSVHNLFDDLIGISQSKSSKISVNDSRKEALIPFFAKEEDGIKYYYDDNEKTTLTIKEQPDTHLEYYHFVNEEKEYIEVYNDGYLVMVRELVDKQSEVQKYFDFNGDVAITIKIENNQLEYIKYQDLYFHSHQELLIYWLTHHIEKYTKINLILDQESQLLNDRELFNNHGINLVPLIQNNESPREITEFIKNNQFEEIFVLNRMLFNQIEPDLMDDCLVRILDGYDQAYQESVKTKIIIDSY
ncbi:coiled-coil domain-containing protein [Vagococcus hydrophili]|uniref:Uncharacterized protein n=1 Tax=Vagococcus hydrophili TaxID=2714947 RepID=A0A6G8ARC8_9ENTE|nr:hypothetical protein [Vagococcus hydrophili]QIL47483.1 hypothetical protein G7082_02500 [Vagococcus hydrophili]